MGKILHKSWAIILLLLTSWRLDCRKEVLCRISRILTKKYNSYLCKFHIFILVVQLTSGNQQNLVAQKPRITDSADNPSNGQKWSKPNQEIRLNKFFTGNGYIKQIYVGTKNGQKRLKERGCYLVNT